MRLSSNNFSAFALVESRLVIINTLLVVVLLVFKMVLSRSSRAICFIPGNFSSVL